MRGIESLKRSIVKSLIWRAIGVVLLGGIAFIITFDVATSLAVTLVFNGIRVVGYVFYEQLWDAIAWGRRAYVVCSRCGYPEACVVGPDTVAQWTACTNGHQYLWLLCPDLSGISVEACGRCGHESGRRSDAPS